MRSSCFPDALLENKIILTFITGAFTNSGDKASVGGMAILSS